MTLLKSAVAGAAILIGVGASTVAGAQTPYMMPPQLASNPYDQAAPVNPQVPAMPPSASYDPYTSGLGPCPQRGGGDEPCSTRLQPSFAQPNYWPGR